MTNWLIPAIFIIVPGFAVEKKEMVKKRGYFLLRFSSPLFIWDPFSPSF